MCLKVFVHGEELESYYKEFDAEILPAEFEGKGPNYDGKAIAAKLFDWKIQLSWNPTIVIVYVLVLYHTE